MPPGTTVTTIPADTIASSSSSSSNDMSTSIENEALTHHAPPSSVPSSPSHPCREDSNCCSSNSNKSNSSNNSSSKRKVREVSGLPQATAASSPLSLPPSIFTSTSSSSSPCRKSRLIDRLDAVVVEVEGGAEGGHKASGSTSADFPAVTVSAQKRQHHHSYSSYHHRSASPSPTRDEEDRRQDKERYRLGSMRVPKTKVEKEEIGGDDKQLQEEEGKQGHGEGGEDEEGSQVDDSFRAEENWEHPTSVNPACKRTLRIMYWDRTRECKERKWDHMDYIDATYASREEWILQSVLHEEEIVLEDNKFPYNTPKGIRHMTLWAHRELSLEEVEAFMADWMETEAREGGREVRRWNLDENASRSIQVYHVHVYVQEVPDEDVGPNPSIEQEEAAAAVAAAVAGEEEAAAAVAAAVAGEEEVPSADGHEDEHDSRSRSSRSRGIKRDEIDLRDKEEEDETEEAKRGRRKKKKEKKRKEKKQRLSPPSSSLPSCPIVDSLATAQAHEQEPQEQEEEVE